MRRSPRALLACVAFAAGASTLAWAQPTLRWMALSPLANGASDGRGVAVLLLGVALGVFASVRLLPNVPLLSRLGLRFWLNCTIFGKPLARGLPGGPLVGVYF